MPFIHNDEMMRHFNIMDNETLSIASAIKLLSLEYSEDEAYELIRQYCLHTTNDTKQRVCLEFLYTNNYCHDLQKLVKKNKASSNELNQKWADIFQLLIDRRLDYFQTEHYHQRLNKIETTNPELICLLELTRLALHYDQGNYDEMAAFDDIHYYYFSAIQDEYLLESFNLKIYHHLFTFYWTRNELILARKYAFRAMNQTRNPYIKASLHMNLGLTYLFDTYQQGIYHLHTSLKMAEVHQFEDIHYVVKEVYIPFLSAHFKQVENVTSIDKGEQAHIEIAKGNVDKAIALLENDQLDTPYKHYYLGLAKQDEEILKQAYTAFIQEKSLYFFARLPLQALKQLKK